MGPGEDSWESLGPQGDPTSPSWRRSVRGVHWTDWCWSWNSNTLATSCEEPTHWKRPWCWEGLGAGGEGDDRGLDGWVASLTRCAWVWVNSGSWWWTGGLACCDSWGHKESDTTERLNWTEPGFTNKVSLGHSLTHSFAYHLWLLLYCKAELRRIKVATWPLWKYLPGLSQKKFADPCPRQKFFQVQRPCLTRCVLHIWIYTLKCVYNSW